MRLLRSPAAIVRAPLRVATSAFMRIVAAASVGFLLATCSQPPSLLQRVRLIGALRVVTRNSPTTFYFGPHGPTGFEYDLAKLFAASLGVRLEIYAPLSLQNVLAAVAAGHADVAAAGLSITPERERTLRFGPPYQYVTEKLVYRTGESRPRSPADLVGAQLTVLADSSHAATLQSLAAKKYPDLTWTASDAVESEELLGEVAHGELSYTVADSNEFDLDRRYFPELRAAFDLKPAEPVAWAFRRTGDLSLYDAAVAFFARIRANGKLAQIIERYYGHSDEFDYVGTRIFIRDIKTRLPTYRSYFQEAAGETGIDWRLLAAIGYQESHWDPHAVSPTGVRGIMMLTLGTAGDLGIENRINVEQSIAGGAQYFAFLKAEIPAEVQEPDRTWMALAAYNVGAGHIADAREITRERGGDPNRWIDVRESLPLLTEKKWYTHTKYGYARGEEPLIYVGNIRSYYSILNWITRRAPAPVTVTSTATPADNKSDSQK